MSHQAIYEVSLLRVQLYIFNIDRCVRWIIYLSIYLSPSSHPTSWPGQHKGTFGRVRFSLISGFWNSVISRALPVGLHTHLIFPFFRSILHLITLSILLTSTIITPNHLKKIIIILFHFKYITLPKYLILNIYIYNLCHHSRVIWIQRGNYSPERGSRVNVAWFSLPKCHEFDSW